MKSALKNLLLLTMGIFLFGCNEKISPELQAGNSTVIPPTVVTPTEYYFSVTNNSATVLNYVLHRTGSGNHSTPCSINSTAPLSSENFIGDATNAVDSKVFDVSCFFEAEELSLFFNGISYNVEASPNTCEYIAYSPYSFFDAIPGSSATSYVGITCDTDNGITNINAAAFATAIGAEYGVGPTPVQCGYMVDSAVPVADRVPLLIPVNNATLCAFNYEANGGGNGQNCDVGTIAFNLTHIYNAEPDTTLPVNPQPVAVSTANYSCGGAVSACVGGAIKSVTEISNGTRGTMIYNTNLNQPFTKSYELPALLGARATNVDIVNYRKGLASLNMNFKDYSTLNDGEWGDMTSNMAFDPSIMEKFAANRKPDNTVIIDTTGLAVNPAVTLGDLTNQVNANGRTQLPYAADPYLGILGLRVSPFYTFYCMDRAYEVKARIRMVVRDWDRVFSSDTTELSLLSDSFKLLSARRQHLPPTDEEIGGDEGPYNYTNDVYYWDDVVNMTRTDTGGDSYALYQFNNGTGSVVWEPTAGWWAPGIFPGQGPR